MKERTISAIFILIILIGSFIISKYVFGIVMAVLSIMAFNEIIKAKYKKLDKKLDIIKLLGIGCLLLMLGNRILYNIDVYLLPLIVLTIPVVIYNDNKVYGFNDSLYVIGSIYLIGIGFNNIIYYRMFNISLCLFIFIIAFITDTYAYIGGSLIGRHKLTTISPKKTIEGSLIGLIMGVMVGSVYYYNLVGGTSIVKVVFLCLVLTLLSEIGDLIFSSIKREYGIKDYSNLIPGHGGILDRFDSILYVSIGLSLILNIL